MKTKICYRCQIPRLLTDFNVDRSLKDRRMQICKKCKKEYRDAHRVEAKHRSKKWRRENPEKRAKIMENYKRTVGAWISYTLSHCKRSLHGCSIESRHLRELWEKQRGKCAISGMPFVLGGGPMRPDKPSIDRINNEKGYHPNNIRIVLLFIQFAKNSWSDEIFSKWCKLIASKLK